MLREEVEYSIKMRISRLWKFYKKYNPDGKYLNISIHENDGKTIAFANNSYWDEDAEKPVNITKIEKR